MGTHETQLKHDNESPNAPAIRKTKSGWKSGKQNTLVEIPSAILCRLLEHERAQDQPVQLAPTSCHFLWHQIQSNLLKHHATMLSFQPQEASNAEHRNVTASTSDPKCKA